MQDLTIESDVITLMSSSTSEEEWNNNCKKVKAAHNDQYPSFWYKAIIMSGLVNRVAATWGASAEIEVFSIKTLD